MIELQLIGYTADGEHLVLDHDTSGDGAFLLRVDGDLLATIERLGGPPPDADTAPPPAGAAGDVVDVDADHVGAPEPDLGDEDDEVAPAASSLGSLTPAEVQARLRSGKSVRAVASEAGASVAAIERWLAPIEAERARVLADARSRRLDVPRAGELGRAVDRALADRGLDADAASWAVARRADGRWRVSVRFDEDGRLRTATWSMDPEGDRVAAASPLATELAGPREGRHR